MSVAGLREIGLLEKMMQYFTDINVTDSDHNLIICLGNASIFYGELEIVRKKHNWTMAVGKIEAVTCQCDNLLQTRPAQLLQSRLACISSGIALNKYYANSFYIRQL